MRCKDCCMWWPDNGEKYSSCHADPNWPAPCEYDDYETDDIDNFSCDQCYHFYNEDSADSVSACNCCDNFSYFEVNKE